MPELRWLWAALLAYLAAGATALVAAALRRRPERAVLATVAIGLVLHTLAIAVRWQRVGHGPFITLFDVLSSNIWSLTLIHTVACWRMPVLRPTAVVVLPLVFVMMAWLYACDPGAGHLPPTYATPWLYVHVGFGKLFLGSVFIGLGIAGLVLLRATQWWRSRLAFLPADGRLDALAFRFMAAAFVFETLMLIAGAIWAQDAWGRYWAWDPLETWAFVTWLVLAFVLHARATLPVAARLGATAIVVVYVLAFMTFFGVPFLSTAPHKGIV